MNVHCGALPHFQKLCHTLTLATLVTANAGSVSLSGEAGQSCSEVGDGRIHPSG